MGLDKIIENISTEADSGDKYYRLFSSTDFLDSPQFAMFAGFVADGVDEVVERRILESALSLDAAW
jgi:hypothetical protein